MTAADSALVFTAAESIARNADSALSTAGYYCVHDALRGYHYFTLTAGRLAAYAARLEADALMREAWAS